MKHLILYIVLWCVILLAVKIAALSNIDYELSYHVYNFMHNEVVWNLCLFASNYLIGTLWGICLVFVIIVWQRGWRLGAFFGVAVILLASLVQILKLLVMRIRPVDLYSSVNYVLANYPTDYGFPSGHSTTAFCASYLIIKIFKLRPKFAVLAYAVAGLVAFSRVYVGAHFILDVVAGMLLGIIGGKISWYLLNWYARSLQKYSRSRSVN